MTGQEDRPGRPTELAAALDVPRFRRAVLDWFDARGRTFSFRGTTDPYLVLVSETLLQQTQISRGGPAWDRFTAQFPTVESLAAASPADVLRAWRGLGYNRRAMNLQRAARIVVNELDGTFPNDVAGLQRLPGVGPYTARAVASIAFRIPTGAVDTNVRRVLGRVLAGDPAGIPPRDLQAAADRLVDPVRPDDWTHALMDIGSTLCRPARPLCPDCPVRLMCRFAAGVRPAPTAPRARPRRQGLAAVEFQATSRWLRGRLLDQLREAPGNSWTTVPALIGDHDGDAIRMALEAMERDRLVELDASGPGRPRARLPTA